MSRPVICRDVSEPLGDRITRSSVSDAEEYKPWEQRRQ
jgi:hypothetical protein